MFHEISHEIHQRLQCVTVISFDHFDLCQSFSSPYCVSPYFCHIYNLDISWISGSVQSNVALTWPWRGLDVALTWQRRGGALQRHLGLDGLRWRPPLGADDLSAPWELLGAVERRGRRGVNASNKNDKRTTFYKTHMTKITKPRKTEGIRKLIGPV